MGKKSGTGSFALAASTAAFLAGIGAFPAAAQQTEAPTPADAGATEDMVIVTGTNLRGARINEALPVIVIDRAQIDSIGGIDGEDLVRSLPTNGAVAFRNDNNSTVNNVRGDVSSINLRSIGSSGTLVLLNGRRVVTHPSTQAELSTPVVTTNVNALPVAGISRVEVLTDGASAIYGTDAVAGVFNTILKDNYDGLSVQFRYGAGLGTELDEQQVTLSAGKTFNQGRTNISFVGEYARRDGLFAGEQAFSASDDLRPRVVGTPFEGNLSFDNRVTQGPWGEFQLINPTRVRQGATNLTTTAGIFHIQPSTLPGCLGTTATTLAQPGICIDDGTLDRDLRWDGASGRSIISDRDRYNLFAFFNHDLAGGTRIYSELGYYFAETQSTNDPTQALNAGPFTVPANNYYNPFGPVTFSDGSTNPNRLPNLVNVPASGLPVYFSSSRYRFVDVGYRNVNVTNKQFRALLGSRGTFGSSNWDFDTAALYNRASAVDVTDNRISLTLLQQSLANETPNTYNFFNGADPANPSTADSTPNPRSVIEPFLINVERGSYSELALADFKVANSALFTLPGGALGLALGAEVRHETYREDRDPRLDGQITFTDSVTGVTFPSDVLGTSDTPDSSGSRQVYALFGETTVPVVSPEMNIPLIQQLDFQIAARWERYSDFGSSGLNPRFAAAWKPVDFLKFRSAWSRGFRAPNLVVINEAVNRSNSREDSLFCEAGVRNGTFANFGACNGFTEGRVEQRVVAPDIGAERDRNLTYGVVLEPRGLTGIFSVLNGLTVTVDRWDIQREGVVGVFGAVNQINLDLLLRTQGSSNPNVVRADPTVDDIAFFTGTGLAAAGEIIAIRDTYDNNESIEVSGTDFALQYRVKDSPLGDFNMQFNATKLRRNFVALSSGAIQINDGVTSGALPADIEVSQEGDLIRQDGQPIWQAAASLTWRHDSGFGGGARVDYTAPYIDTGVGLDPNGNEFEIAAFTTMNLYAEYQYGGKGLIKDIRFRVGVNNLLDKEPPLADEDNGFDAAYHSARGRFLYFDVRKEF